MTYAFVKRTLDIIGSVCGLIIFSPLLLLVAVAIKLDSEGPILVEESNRVGQAGKVFRMYKFRSMIKNSHQLIRTDPKYKEILKEYQGNSYKLQHDPRITRFGSLLRKTSLDEFPQFINVLKGDMSLVGPRAYYPDELAVQRKKHPGCESWVRESLSIKPGITGLWQVSGRSKIGFEQRIELDSQYARAKSIWLDLSILAKTPKAVFSGEGVI